MVVRQGRNPSDWPQTRGSWPRFGLFRLFWRVSSTWANHGLFGVLRGGGGKFGQVLDIFLVFLAIDGQLSISFGHFVASLPIFNCLRTTQAVDVNLASLGHLQPLLLAHQPVKIFYVPFLAFF